MPSSMPIDYSEIDEILDPMIAVIAGTYTKLVETEAGQKVQQGAAKFASSQLDAFMDEGFSREEAMQLVIASFRTGSIK